MFENTEELALLRSYRRDLHRIPELDFELPKTISYVRQLLEAIPQAQVFSPYKSTVCAFFDKGTTCATAVRSDMDALPVRERTGAAYASCHPGKMHACGHDGHMAMVLGLAGWLGEHIHELPRSVLLVFQPAEETTGGAHGVCESGVFEKYGVDRIFGFHLWPDLPFGSIASRPGALLASSNEIDVRFVGKSSHIARWQEGRDALLACSRFVAQVSAEMKALPMREPSLLRFGKMEAGTVRNAIAAAATVQGSLRSFAEQDREAAQELIRRSAEKAAEAAGCSVELSYSDGNPPVVNHTELFELVSRALPHMSRLEEPLLIAEDFAWYQRYLPGVFMLLGTGTGIPLHADTFDFDEKVLTRGLDAYRTLVMLP